MDLGVTSLEVFFLTRCIKILQEEQVGTMKMEVTINIYGRSIVTGMPANMNRPVFENDRGERYECRIVNPENPQLQDEDSTRHLYMNYNDCPGKMI